MHRQADSVHVRHVELAALIEVAPTCTTTILRITRSAHTAVGETEARRLSIDKTDIDYIGRMPQQTEIETPRRVGAPLCLRRVCI